ncbi:MAG: ribulose-phosphate 3-epimerase [Candidatus Neomarinimicrobiota bacterium]
MARIAPSILSSDFANLEGALDLCRKGGADQIHVDVMDGHFVPNLTIGPVVVKDIRKATSLPLDVHLMIENPERFIPEFVKAGSDFITVHAETCPNLEETIRLIKGHGVRAGITLKPGTPLESIANDLSSVSLVLVMSVEPGFGEQEFIPGSLNRIEKLREILQGVSPKKRPEISVDGGIKLQNAKAVIDAGADILVSGSGVFGTEDPVATIKAFKEVK